MSCFSFLYRTLRWCRLPALLICAGTTSCTKTIGVSPQAQAAADSVYSNRLQFVVTDNFTFTLYYTGLGFIGLQDTLAQPGPFTVLAPANSGFNNPAYWYIYSAANIPYFWTTAYIQDFFRYTVLDGRYSIDSMPLGDNQQLPTPGGFHVYVSKYVQGGDTVATVNGSLLTNIDGAATNGLLDALSIPINPEESHTVIDRIDNDERLTFFALALQRVGLDSVLANGGPWTVLAPENGAFANASGLGAGLSTMDSLLLADTAVLGRIVRGHILRVRYFVNDFARNGNGPGDTLRLVSLNGEPVTFYMGSLNYSGPEALFLGGSGNGTPAQIYPTSNSIYQYNGDIAAGNGVLQKIDQVLVP